MHFLFGFSGRIGRGKWWLAQLAILLLMVGGLVAFVMLMGPDRIKGMKARSPGSLPVGAILMMLAMLALMTWINIAATVKRFHDRNKPGVWFLIMFVPYIGSLWQIVECGCLAGTEGDNDFGPPGGTGANNDATPSYAAPARLSAAARQNYEPSATPSSARVPSVGRQNTSSFGRRGL